MLYYVKGPLVRLLPNLAVIEAGGVGYCMTISDTTHAALAPLYDALQPKTARLYTYLVVREDGIELFGFYSEEELSAFRMLISVSGIGPKAGISILSALTPEKLALAICTEDRKALSSANGIGAKTAARIILELKDKISKESVLAAGDAPSPILTSAPVASSQKMNEATDALLVLGYSRAEALTALKDVDVSTLPLEDVIRAALKKLM